MKKTQYGEFKFSKSPARPAVKGYAYGGATPSPTATPSSGSMPSPDPMAAAAARKPTVAPKPAPKPTPTPAPISPAMQRQQENQAFINKLNADPKRAGNPLLIDKPAMTAAVNKNQEIKAATDARLKAEAKANTVVKNDPNAGLNRSMNAVQARSSTPIQRAKGGEVKKGLWDNIHAKQDRIKNGSGERMRKAGSKGAPSAEDFKNSASKMKEGGSADMAQDKAMIKKAIKQHDQQEHKGGKGTTLHLRKGGKAAKKEVKLVGMRQEPNAQVIKEVSLLKKAGAPAKMIKEERKEIVSPLASMGGMKNGGSAKKGVPTFNRTPKC